MSSTNWGMVGALAAIIMPILVFISPFLWRTGAKLAHAIGRCIRNTTLWCVHTVVSCAATVYNKVSERHSDAKRTLTLRWIIWRKRMRLNIQRVITQDKGLQQKSATANERIGMAAILLAELLADDRYIQGDTCKQVFACVRNTDPGRFHMLCARIANDIVINPEAQIGETGSDYIVPWDSLLEEFLRDALDEPRVETRPAE